MLINLTDILEKYKISPTGVIHVGAHHGQEYSTYVENEIFNVLFVEPSPNAFSVLQERFKHKPSVELVNAACGFEESILQMNIENNNQGQSNSLLKPKKHLEVHPEIQFTGTIDVKVVKLDSLKTDSLNLLVMDVQGYEKFVLQGGLETLKHVDFVYSEVNQAELYEGCTQINELDEILNEFTRVETVWCGDTGWGDAFWIRTDLLPKVPETFVPMEFRPPMPIRYPEDNSRIFEIEYFLQSDSMPELPKTFDGRVYLPILWTSYYVVNNYGKNQVSIMKLQAFIDSLPRNLKYYTIVQYDDGILNDISELDIIVFAMAGNRIDYALPLICQPHAWTFEVPKKFIANFVGNDNHPIRTNLIRTTRLASRYYVNGRRLDLPDFCELLAKSTFTLCPRGYGATSFRIMEALQQGSIPVYISDFHILPHNSIIPFTEYGVIIHPEEVKDIVKILKSIPDEKIDAMRNAGKKAYQELYTYDSNIKIIKQLVNGILQ